MGDTRIIPGLTRKRAELGGLIMDYGKRIGQARADLVHISSERGGTQSDHPIPFNIGAVRPLPDSRWTP